MQRHVARCEREMLGHQFTATVIARCNGNKDVDFTKRPVTDKPRQSQGWQEQLTLAETLNLAFGGKDLRGGKQNNSPGPETGDSGI